MFHFLVAVRIDPFYRAPGVLKVALAVAVVVALESGMALVYNTPHPPLPPMPSFLSFQGVQPLLDGVVDYLPCPAEVNNYALDQSKGEEKVCPLAS